MNLHGTEERIQQLFREMSGEEQRLAPRFSAIVESARSRTAESTRGTRSLVFLGAAAVIMVFVVMAMVLVVRGSRSQPTVGTLDQIAVAPPAPEHTYEVQSVVSPVKAKLTTSGVARPRRVARRRPADELAIHMKTLSSWKSPTASLLAIPEQENLKSLPRLGEALRSIKSFSPDQFN